MYVDGAMNKNVNWKRGAWFVLVVASLSTGYGYIRLQQIDSSLVQSILSFAKSSQGNLQTSNQTPILNANFLVLNIE